MKWLLSSVAATLATLAGHGHRTLSCVNLGRIEEHEAERLVEMIERMEREVRAALDIE